MTIDDVHYFNHNRYMQPGNYRLAKNVEMISNQNKNDKAEFMRRLKILHGIKDNVEHQARSGDFISEMETFEWLHRQGKRPHWVPESKQRGVMTPDICYEHAGSFVAVEVKTLGLDLVEGTALRQGQTYSNGPDWSYFEGVQKKLDHFFKDVEAKFQSFNKSDQPSGEFYLHYFPSQHVRFRDGEDGLPPMKERVLAYAGKHLSPHVRFVAINVLED